jgi:hypothetical protein
MHVRDSEVKNRGMYETRTVVPVSAMAVFPLARAVLFPFTTSSGLWNSQNPFDESMLAYVMAEPDGRTVSSM